MAEFEEAAAVRFLETGGKWQYRQMILALIGNFTGSFQILLIVFTGFQPNFVCVDTTKDTNTSFTVKYDNKCGATNTTNNATSTCDEGYMYDVNTMESIVSDWDLVCDKAYFAQTTQVMYSIGMGLGSIFSPLLSDKFGRKRTYLALRVFYSIGAFGILLSPNVYWFMAGRLLIGTFGMGFALVQFVTMVENIPAKLRPFATVMSNTAWSLALCVEAGATYLMRHQSWRTVQAVMSVPTLSFLIELFFLEESIRWLYTNNKKIEASGLLRRALRLNRLGDKDIQNEMAVLKTKPETITEDSHETEASCVVNERLLKKEKLSILDILRNHSTRVMAIKITFAWFINSLVYYAIFFMSDSFSGDRHLNFFLNGIVEIPASLIAYGLLKWFGRKKLLVGFHFVCAAALILGGILMVTLKNDVKYTIMMIVSVIGKFSISITFMCLYVYTSEVFPTNFRTSGMGLGSASARVGSLLSPFAGILARELPWGPGIIFGGLCLILSIMFLWVPETKDKKLPQNMLEIETIINRKELNGKDRDHAQ